MVNRRSDPSLQVLSSQPDDALLTVALVQLCSTDNVRQNCERALNQIRNAAGQGARFVLLPENICYIRREGERMAWCESLDGDVVALFRQLARQHRVYVLLGSIPERIPGSDKVYNTSLLIEPEGRISASYRKLHLFDAVLPDGQVLSESRFVERGSELTVADVDGIKVGLSICYDLRFPELYSALALAGAQIITVPSAFTVPTGRVHWEILLRARAIESQVYILAPAQTGQHSASRSSYGHSLIVDPWGRIVASAGEEETLLISTLDLAQVRQVQEQMPCRQHRRFEPPQLCSKLKSSFHRVDDSK